MTTSATPASTTAISSARQAFLDTYEREHAITMKVLRAFPPDKLDLQPHPKCKTARDLAWIFVQECGLGTAAMHDAFAKGQAGASTPQAAPENWDDLLAALEKAHADFRNTFTSFTDEQLHQPIKFFVGPKTMGDYSRIDFAWFLLHDQIHHRGQFSIYLRMADAKVPSIYGPTLDEPWR